MEDVCRISHAVIYPKNKVVNLFWDMYNYLAQIYEKKTF